MKTLAIFANDNDLKISSVLLDNDYEWEVLYQLDIINTDTLFNSLNIDKSTIIENTMWRIRSHQDGNDYEFIIHLENDENKIKWFWNNTDNNWNIMFDDLDE